MELLALTGVHVLLIRWCVAVSNSRLAIVRDLIEVLLVGEWANNVNHLVERHIWVLLEVSVRLITQYSIVTNFFEIDRRH